MLDNLQNVNVFTPDLTEIMLNISVSLLCGLIISFVYRFTHKSPGYSEGFVNSIVFLSLITTLVIMVIGNNLARAFGLVGAMSIIRFRTAIKDTMDIVYIFFSLTIGMASGVGYYKLSIAGTVFICLILLVFTKLNITGFRNEQYLLQFSINTGISSEKDFLSVFDSFFKHYKIINLKSLDDSGTKNYSFYVSFKRKISSSDFVTRLTELTGVSQVNLFFDEEKI
ncbi:MAG: DUF4956 domain-containing protein [Bacteroidetes bacterium]|nr:DUF4956 domain-containing protein [Bacteroidota bacterium]